MQDEHRETSELMRSGCYFPQARQWYTALYIAPIAERSLFLVLVTLAILVGILGLVAFSGLMPLRERPPVMVANPRLNDTMPSLIRLRDSGMDVNEALLRYHVAQYVLSRESYVAGEFARNSLFVTAHSDAATSAAYVAAVGPDNPRNPSAMLGIHGTRKVAIQSLTIDQARELSRATVRFSTEIGGTAPGTKTQWTATLQFYYSDAVASETTDPTTGEIKASLQEPQFQVVNYVLSQTP